MSHKLIKGKTIEFASIEDAIAFSNGWISLEEVNRRLEEARPSLKRIAGTFTVAVKKDAVEITYEN